MLFDGTVLENRPLTEDYNLLTLQVPGLPQGVMGQFVELRTSDQKQMLRRPFTVFRQDGERLTLLYKVIGTATHFLLSAVPGQHMSLMAMLGNGFAPDHAARTVLVGRGVGLATFGLAPCFFRPGAAVHLVASFRSPEAAAPLLSLFSQGYQLHPVYDSDGSSAPNRVLELVRSLAPQSCYTCGSHRLLKCLRELPCPVYVSLEERMACGIGSCQGCVVDTIHGYRRVCKDGPCFSAKEVLI